MSAWRTLRSVVRELNDKFGDNPGQPPDLVDVIKLQSWAAATERQLKMMVKADGADSLGKRLRLLREAREWTLQELSQRTDISISYLSQLERGEKDSPSLDLACRLAQTMHITVGQLAGEEKLW